MKRRILSCLLAVALIITLLPAMPLRTQAATGGTTGSCSWELNGTVLTISGSNFMGDYTECGPWGTGITKVVFASGVMNVGAYDFKG